MKTFIVWLKGLLAAGITAFCTAAISVLVMPNVFTLDKVGFLNMFKIAVTPTLISVLAYLKDSPVPKE